MSSIITIIFQGGKSLSTDTDLLLTFDNQDMPGMYSSYNPVVWKTTAFAAGGGGSFWATYTSTHAFTKAQVDSGVVQPAEFFTPINVQEQTTLTVTNPNPPNTYAFSAPIPSPGLGPGQFECINQTDAIQNIGVGFNEEGEEEPTTSLVLKSFPNSIVIAQFTPILSAYVISGFKRNQIITAKISSPLNWSQDLTAPHAQLVWVLEETDAGYTLIPGTLDQ